MCGDRNGEGDRSKHQVGGNGNTDVGQTKNRLGGDRKTYRGEEEKKSSAQIIFKRMKVFMKRTEMALPSVFL